MAIIKFDEIKYSLKNLSNRKLRSFLSILSILIGITAIFAIVSLGMGLQNYMNTMAEEAGTNRLMMYAKGAGIPGTDENFFITQDDIDFVEKINGVDEITGAYFKAAEINFREQKKFNYVIGMDINELEFMLESFNIDVIKGRELKKGDLHKVLFGYNYQFDNKIFKKGIKVGDKVEINSVKFDVIGFYSEIGSAQDDAQVYVTQEAFEELYPDAKDHYGFLYLKAREGVEPSELAEKITEKLRKHKGQEEGKEDFYVQSFEDLIETFSKIMNVLNGILILISMISLIVASVNIMNTMYTAVLERTKEIGIMKAVGARNSNILFIFVVESGILGMIGGSIGVFFGFVIANIGGSIAGKAGYALLKPIFPWYLIVGCILFSFLLGALSGLIPAIRASKQKPVDALRYE